MWTSFSRRCFLLFSLRFSSSSTSRMDGGLATMWTPFSRRSIFSLRLSSSSRTPSAYAVRTSQFLSSCNYSSHAFPRLEGKDNVRVSVWWNSDVCSLPDNVDITRFVPAMTAIVRDEGVDTGHMEFSAFGDIVTISRENGDDLRYPEINFIDVPEVRIQRHRTDKILFWEVVKWVEKNPPPALLLFICTGSYLYELLKELKMREYNIIVISTESDDSSDSFDVGDLSLSTLTKIQHLTNSDPEDLPILDLRDPKKGDDKVTVILDIPRDYSSGEVPIEDLVSTTIPAAKSVMSQIQDILKSHPDGILLDPLRRKLVKVDWKLNLRYYDTWLFSRFLLSFPEIVQMETSVDGTVVKSV